MELKPSKFCYTRLTIEKQTSATSQAQQTTLKFYVNEQHIKFLGFHKTIKRNRRNEFEPEMIVIEVQEGSDSDRTNNPWGRKKHNKCHNRKERLRNDQPKKVLEYAML